ncbi:MAG: hypothetical protein K2H64_04010 [Desulfovibrio sp.]|nr:hypothetical protein [Desulfovibrio sp.]
MFPIIIFALASGAFLAPFLYAFGFCYPRGDDFDFAIKAMFFPDPFGALYEVGREWLTWSGRCAFHFLAVFFGRAADSRILCGLVCLSVALLFAVGAARFLSLRLPKRRAALAAPAVLLALFAFYGNLPDFYLYTDSLSVTLQEAAYLLFLGLFCEFLNSGDDIPRSLFVKTLLAGLFAAGVYEHAAFATGWTLFAILVFFDWKRAGAGVRRNLLKLTFFLGCGVCFSLFAPGNFARRASRGVDAVAGWERLASAPAEWLAALNDFLSFPGFAGFLALALLLGLYQRPAPLSRRVALAALFAFAGFSLIVVFAQALSDAPFSSSPKFNASLGFYAALCGFIIIFVAASRGKVLSDLSSVWARTINFSLGALFFCCVAASGNFQNTVANVLNGNMTLLADFMRARDEGLLAVADPAVWPERGLVGEIKNPDARKIKIDPAARPFEVLPVLNPVFPVYIREALSGDPRAWPNPYAAWARSIPAIRALSMEEIGELAANGGGLELRPSPELGEIASARLVPVRPASGVLPITVLALEFRGNFGGEIEVLRPSPLMVSRPSPLFLREKLLNWLLEQKTVSYSFAAGLTAAVLRGERRGQTAFIPLRVDYEGIIWPDVVFVSLKGGAFYRLRPWL